MEKIIKTNTEIHLPERIVNMLGDIENEIGRELTGIEKIKLIIYSTGYTDFSDDSIIKDMITSVL